jgi:two-component system, NarL family, sensor kinase
MKMYYYYFLSFLVFSSKINAVPFVISHPENSLSREGQYEIFTSSLINFSQQSLEFKCILLILFLLAVILFLTRKNLQLNQNVKQFNLLLNQREQYYKAMIEAEEKEKLYIVRSLHDNIGQQLSAAKLNISALQSFSMNVNAADKLMIQKAVDLIDTSVKGIRSAAHAIIPTTLIKSGLVSALMELITNSNAAGNIKINLDLVGHINRFSQSDEVILFRILYELINNSLKHSKASEINVQLIKHENELTILVQDNGVGFILDTMINLETGLGLKCVQAQIIFLKANIFFDSQLGKGSTISIEMPLTFVK